MPVKQVLCAHRLRRVPRQFSWIDQRLVRDRHICRCDAPSLALYLFLVTVADARGLSCYGEASIAKHLSLDRATLRQARRRLLDTGLIAYEQPLYQVLALEGEGACGACRACRPAARTPPGAALRRALTGAGHD